MTSPTAVQNFKSVATLFSGNIARFALGFLASALTYRALTPEKAGLFTLAISLVGVVSFVAEFGFRDAAVNYVASAATEREAADVARAFLAAKLLLGTLAALLLSLLADWMLGAWYGNALQPGLLQFAALSLLTGGLLNYGQAMLEARRQYQIITLAATWQAVARSAAITILFVFGQLEVVALVAIEVAMPLAVAVYCLLRLPRGWRSVRPPLLPQLSRLWQFSRWLAIASAASTIFLRLDVLILGTTASAAELGLYGAAMALILKFDSIKNAVIITVFPDACAQTTKPQMLAYIQRTLKLTLPIAAACLLFAPLSPLVIRVLYGEAYANAVPPLLILLAVMIVGLIVEPIAYLLYPLEKPHLIAVIDGLLLLCMLALGMALIPTFGALGAASAMLGTRLIGGVLTVSVIGRQLQ